MEKQNKHLNIDLEFLEGKGTPRDKARHDESRSPLFHGRKYNWKNIFLVGGLILFFVWVIVSNDGATRTNTDNYEPPIVNQPSSDNDAMVFGEYRCSKYHYSQAAAINPDKIKQQLLIAAQNELRHRGSELDRLKSEINNTHVNDYSSQYEIDQYNEMVDEYNSKLASYNRDVGNSDSEIDVFNAQVERHNNYLMTNCTKVK